MPNDQEFTSFAESPKRMGQQLVRPSIIKQVNISEGPRFVRSGLEANLPTVGEATTPSSSAIYFATDTNKLYIYNGTAWVSTTLS